MIDAHIPAFQYARDNDIFYTAHVGETRGIENVRDTLQHFAPSRLGHGVCSIEDPARAAPRELGEETGYDAATWRSLGRFWTAPGFTDERIHLFLAIGLEKGRQALEEHEVIECRRMSLARAVEMVLSGDIVDGKTVSLVLMAAVTPGLQSG